MRFDKRQLQAMIFILICMVLYTGWYTHSSKKDNYLDGIIRFHVVANSNSAQDQRLKLKVRDGVLEAVNNKLVKETMEKYDSIESVPQEGVKPENDKNEIATETMAVVDSQTTVQVSLNSDEARLYLQSNLDLIQEIAEKIIKDNGYDYEATVELGVRWIPEKIYGDMIFPAGNYEALNISIGAGEGNNWWCVLFPPLCLIDGSEDVNQFETFEATSYAAIGMTEELLELRKNNKNIVPTQAAIKLKFKTLELLQK